MPEKTKHPAESHLKSILLAYGVLVLHLVLIAGLGLLVLFFRGVIQYMIWIFLGGSAAIIASAWHFYRRMKREGKTLREMLQSPIFRNRPVEISILGGIASLKIGKNNSSPEPDHLPDTWISPHHQIEDATAVRVRELTELVRMLENDFITLEEFNLVKQQLLKG
ncbi:MAG TPA: hypothetical protein VLP30_03475 [Desulfatirhabdiaceae bacterium]|nr:hypothetical protein [Desulfatirhabdiaceae bacterium]